MPEVGAKVAERENAERLAQKHREGQYNRRWGGLSTVHWHAESQQARKR